MSRALTFLLTASVALGCSAARPDLSAYADDARLLVDTALRDGQAYERLGELTGVAPHRLAGSAGYQRAAEWAREQMLADGLENVRFEQVLATHWERGDTGRVTILEPERLAGTELPMLALGGSIATPVGGLRAEVIVADGLAAAAELGNRARGKIVLFNQPMDPTKIRVFEAYSEAVPQRSRGAQEAAKVGAVAALVRTMSNRIDDVPHTGAMRYADDVEKIPTAAISTRAAETVAALVAAGERVVLEFEQDCRTLEPKQNPNVIGEIVGSERPDEILVVGGHLDAWDIGQGAHDDGGGCVQALEALRLIKSLGLRPRRTLRVVLFANEENGLAGGRGYAEQHLDEMLQHLLALESDSGVFTPRGFTTNAEGRARALLESAAALLDFTDAGVVETGGGGADIGPMKKHGVLQVGFRPDGQRYFDIHHCARDTMNLVSEREIELGAGVIAGLLWTLADMPHELPRGPVTAEG